MQAPTDNKFALWGKPWDWTMGAFRSPELWIPLVLFTVVGVAVTFAVTPAEWGFAWRTSMGLLLGVFSWMFPYCNRVLDEDWVSGEE